MKKLLLLILIIAAITNCQAQVTGSGTTGNLAKWNSATSITNSLLREDATTVIMGNSLFTTPWNFMYLHQSGSSTQSTGLNIELFGNNPSGTGQAAAFNVQNNPTNIGINSYTANGTNSTAGLFEAINATNNIGVSGTASNGAESYGGRFMSKDASDRIVGVYAEAVDNNFPSSPATIGVDAVATANDGYECFGLKSIATATGANTRVYGVHATIAGGNPAGSWAGYFEAYGGNAGFFNGDVWRTGADNFTSDRKFKEEINPIENAISIIKKLQSKTYTFKKDFKTFNFDEGRQFGFIAQELEEVLPELVNEAINPARYDTKGKKIANEVKFKGVEYVQLIPILTAGIQEQQHIIESQNERIEALESRLRKLEASTTDISTTNNVLDGAELFQNVPNPFRGYTSIGYRLPENTSDAKILIFDMNGRKIKQVQLEGTGEGKVDINATELSAGMYLYSLMINGAEAATKRMILE